MKAKNSLTKDKNISIKNQPKSKKIGFFSAILLVIGSSIGAGIFVKNGEILGNVQHSILLSLISWFVAIVAILAMGLTLTELCSSSKVNDQGIIGWVKTFNNKFFYKGAKNFMAFLYLPLNFFVMPLYAIMQLQDAFHFSLPWWCILILILVIFSWFVLVSGLNSKAGNIQNWIITSVKFLPIIFAALIGFILLSLGVISVENPIMPNPPTPPINTPLFNQLTPVLGIFASIPAIFFAFDGFYSTAGLQSQMAEPKKVSLAMSVGISIVAFIDVMISLSLLICSPTGTIGGILWLQKNNWLLSLINTLIAFGILGIINGFAIYTPRFYEDLIRSKELYKSEKFINRLNPNKPIVGAIITICLTSTIIFIFGLIGSLGYVDTSGAYSNTYYGDNHVAGLYSFCDLMANWTSILAFACIVLAIIGCLINRKTKKVNVIKDKFFVPAAWVSSLLVGFGIIFILIQTFVNIGLVANYNIKNLYDTTHDGINALIGAIMALVSLIIFIFVIIAEPLYFKIKNK